MSTKNLVVNGCSYTSEIITKTWVTPLRENYSKTTNLASIGAGNSYITKSTIDYLEYANLNPEDTTVIIMWSGIGRKDLLISEEQYRNLGKSYDYIITKTNKTYYLFSGGLSGSWLENRDTKNIFWNIYKQTDPLSLCKESLFNFIMLENYLQNKGYKYIFTNFFNCWDVDSESTLAGDYSIGHFCKNDSGLFKNIKYENWLLNDQLGDYAHNKNSLDDTGHPTESCHKQWSNEILQPFINNVHM